MIVHRRAAALIATILVASAPAPALAARGLRPARLSTTPPGWLSSKPSSGGSAGSAPGAGAQRAPAGSSASGHVRASLPRTGFEILPEVLVGAALLMAGLMLARATRSRRA